MGLGGTAKAGTFFNLYCHLCLETVFPGLKLTQNCYLHYNINIFSGTKIVGKGTKISTFKLFSELDKIWKCNLDFSENHNFPSFSWIGESLKVYTAPDQHFKIQILNPWINWEMLCPNLSFPVQNKMGNSHKKGWSYFKLNISKWLRYSIP